MYFSGIYQTAKTVYTGARTTVLDYSYACYNGNSSGCATAIVGAPVSSRTAYDLPNNQSLFSYSNYAYDQHGNLTGETDYNYAAGGNPILKQTTIVYNSTLCSSYNICDRPYVIQVTNGTNVTSYAILGYDERGSQTHGSLTTVSRYISGTSGANLSQTYAYNSNGTLASATDPNGTATTYSYAGTSCNNAFPTSVTVNSLTTSYVYNCTGGVVTSVTDPNQYAVSTSYTDQYYWRPASVGDQLSPPKVTSYTYPAVGQVEAVMTFSNGNGGNSTSDLLTTHDSLGRPYLQQTREGPGSGNWDTVQYMYDTSGRVLWLLFARSSAPPLAKAQGVGCRLRDILMIA